MSVSTDESFYQRIGGEPAVSAAVTALYRVILADDRLAGYFAGVDLDRLSGHMVALLSRVLGGPDAYSGRDLRGAHRHLGVTAAHYDLVGAYLIGILAGLGVDDEVLGAVRGVLEASADEVID
ncbi:group I truncated hemoglobin [Actinoplanes aureus]|uniref:Group 1 truncated hemoglobin n=1 Tax=Actinoplanes aureus TaxID=2792083 RepID=A0A931CLL3_9ACTN|nr:group 1 truncated hemoglobin [Actinoplanes aureus]MBG0568518.1 group 1 truncated hemoglobin [Actinoplanes aureus]